jgi:predicted MarR family transcription regulator
MATTQLQSIALTQDDIDLITYALRKLYNETGFSTLRDNAKDLIEYIEKENIK